MSVKAAGFVIYRVLSGQIQYLLLKASYGSHHWTPPKGHVDPGEDDYTTALRETCEEAGFVEDDLQIYKDISKTLNYKVKNRDKIVIYWLAQLINPHQLPKLSEEHEDFKWLAKDDAKTFGKHTEMMELIDFCDEQIQKLQAA